jgi:hypothetical protein
MMKVGITDFERLVSELNAMNEKNPVSEMDGWFENHNLEDEVREFILGASGSWFFHGVNEIIQETINQKMEEAEENGELEGNLGASAIHLGSNPMEMAAGVLGLAMFQLGWEAHTQFQTHE